VPAATTAVVAVVAGAAVVATASVVVGAGTALVTVISAPSSDEHAATMSSINVPRPILLIVLLFPPPVGECGRRSARTPESCV